MFGECPNGNHTREKLDGKKGTRSSFKEKKRWILMALGSSCGEGPKLPDNACNLGVEIRIFK